MEASTTHSEEPRSHAKDSRHLSSIENMWRFKAFGSPGTCRTKLPTNLQRSNGLS